MAKKKPDPPPDAAVLVMVGGRIPESLHKQVKHAAVDEGVSLQEFLTRALRERVASTRERKSPS